MDMAIPRGLISFKFLLNHTLHSSRQRN
uniref:Uncharacterized protein MANES_01G059200 n=1 Tax=Rhizophora mucronata TaxID=61149 RepID=A0A2P2PHM6_RHIMU